MNKYFALVLVLLGTLGIVFTSYGTSKEFEVFYPDPLTESVWMKEMGIKQERLRLANGMWAWLIHDPNTPRSVMSIHVASGTMQDPQETMGCAHLVEHMVFMGSTKFPGESEFSDFIRNVSGTTNAMTSPTSTTYGFTCRNEDVAEAFERLTDVVRAPLLKQDSIDREKQAVNEEFRQKISGDGYRSWLMRCDLIDSSHSLHQLGCGNSQTLERVTAEDLKNWYKAHYFPSDTLIVLLTSHDLETQKKWVSSYWSDWQQPELNKKEVMAKAQFTLKGSEFAQATSLVGKNSLTLTWSISLPKKEDILSLNHIASWMGHEFPQGLCDYLKKEGYAFSAGASTHALSRNGFFFFNIDLTPKGALEIEKCLSAIQDYIEFLQREPLTPRWAIEQQNRVKNSWESATFQATLEQGFNLAQAVEIESLQTLPFNSMWPTENSTKLAQKMLSELHIEKGLKILFLADPSMAPHSDHIASKVEPWSQTPYEIRSLNLHQSAPFTQWSRTLDNPFLPQKLPSFARLKESQKASVSRSELFDFIHYENAFCGGLRDSLYVAIHVDEKTLIQHKVFWPLFISCFNEKNRVLYQHAFDAGQALSLQGEESGLSIHLNGYSATSAQQVLEELIASFSHADINLERFEQHKAELIENLKSMSKLGPRQRLRLILRNAFIQNSMTPDELLEQIEGTTYESFLKMHQVFLKSPIRLTAAAVSARESEWIECLNRVSRTFENIQKDVPSPFPSYPFPQPLKKSIPQEIKDYHLQTEGNLALFVWPLSDKDEDKQRLSLKMIEPMLAANAFNHLRSEQQLGYIVQAGLTHIEQKAAFFLLVLSSNKTAEEITSAMKAEVKEWKEAILTLSKEDFEKNQSRLEKELLEPIETSSEELQKILELWPRNTDPYITFKKLLKELREITLEESQERLQELLSEEPYYVYCLPKSQEE